MSRGRRTALGVRQVGPTPARPRGPAGESTGRGLEAGDCLLGVRQVSLPRPASGPLLGVSRSVGWRPETTCRGSVGCEAGRVSRRRHHILGGAISRCLCSHLAGPEKLGISRSISSGTPRREQPTLIRGSLPPRSPAKPRASQEGSWCNLEGGSWLSEGVQQSLRGRCREAGRRWGEVPLGPCSWSARGQPQALVAHVRRRPVLAQLTGADPSQSLWPFWGMGVVCPRNPGCPRRGHPTSAWWTWLD